MVLLYFIAGFLAPALPWAPIAAIVTNGVGVWRDYRRDAFLARWREVSPTRARAIVAGRWLAWIAIDTLAMLLANWLSALA